MILDTLARARRSAYLLIGCTCAAASIPAAAAIVSTAAASVTVTSTFAYTAFDGGDFIFSTSGSAPGCGNGWWISPSDPGFKSAVATVLAAQVSGSFVVVYGDNAALWSGSPSGRYCRVQTVGLSS
jgi:hypothetical protein